MTKCRAGDAKSSQFGKDGGVSLTGITGVHPRTAAIMSRTPRRTTGRPAAIIGGHRQGWQPSTTICDVLACQPSVETRSYLAGIGPRDEPRARGYSWCNSSLGIRAKRTPTTAKEYTEMAGMRETAGSFVEACDSGKGWAACQQYCEADARFTAQAAALADIDTVEAYAGWAKGLLTPLPDARCEIRSLAVDEERSAVIVCAIFRGTHSGEGGPLPPTGKQVESDYVYLLEFDGDRIRRMTKIWNDTVALQQLGWV